MDVPYSDVRKIFSQLEGGISNHFKKIGEQHSKISVSALLNAEFEKGYREGLRVTETEISRILRAHEKKITNYK